MTNLLLVNWQKWFCLASKKFLTLLNLLHEKLLGINFLEISTFYFAWLIGKAFRLQNWKKSLYHDQFYNNLESLRISLPIISHFFIYFCFTSQFLYFAQIYLLRNLHKFSGAAISHFILYIVKKCLKFRKWWRKYKKQKRSRLAKSFVRIIDDINTGRLTKANNK